MEVNSVNRAINIARAFVGSIMAFIIAPITILILINAVAFIKGIPMFSFWFIWDWLKLTASSIWWVIRCATCFSCDNQIMDVAYNHHALLRLAWILIPTVFIWLRSTNTLLTRLMVIPFMVLILYITYQREASPTFLDKHLPEEWRDFKIDNILNFRKATSDIRDFVIKDETAPEVEADRINRPESPTSPTRTIKTDQDPKPQAPTEEKVQNEQIEQIKTIASDFKDEHYKIILMVLLVLLLAAAFLHFQTKFRLLALILLLISLGGFVLMSQKTSDKPKTESPTTITQKMLEDFVIQYQANKGRASVELTNLSIDINERLKDGKGSLPDKYCELYKAYFYDFCLE